MADIRIKDLTTTASTTAADDFFAADGATSGTRKLSAYSPTFGGNATVGGTLTVTGVVTASNAVNVSGIIGTTAVAQRITNTSGAFQIYKDATPSIAARFSLNTAASDIAAIGVYNGSSWTDPLQINTTQVLVTTTTASTSTSTGALVVGNGTSGGLGVGGAGYFGGNVVGTQSIIARGNIGSPGSIGLTAFIDVDTVNSVSRVGSYNFTTSAWSELQINGGGGNVKVGNPSSVLTINGTTASTGTSSGALVVSGGVGVAGAIFAGGVLSTVSGAGFNTPDWRFYQSGTSGYIRDLVNGQMALQFVSGSASTIQVYATGTQDSTSTTSGALISAGGIGAAGAVNAGTFFGLVDGVTAPSTAGGYARIYVDSADGDLKVKFGDGTVKTIATDS